jgi:Protein of unknown function (DUF2867)
LDSVDVIKWRLLSLPPRTDVLRAANVKAGQKQENVANAKETTRSDKWTNCHIVTVIDPCFSLRIHWKTDLPEHAMRPIAVPPPKDCTNVLPSADFSDAFAIDVRNATLDAPEATRRAFAGQPGWIAKLLAIRNILVMPFGLKSGADANLPEDRRVGIFPVILSSSERVVLGFDDTHLNFRIVVDVKSLNETTRRVTATTLVHRNNIFGRLYLAAVMPFHKLIVPSMLTRLSEAPG